MKRRNPLTALLLLGSVLLSPLVALATPGDQHLSVNGVEIYYGVLPEGLVQGSLPMPDRHDKASSAASHHLVVALYDTRTRQRISDATVTARVSTSGYWHEDKPLPVMAVAGQSTYGNFFTLSGSDTYRVDLSIQLRGTSTPIKASFEYRHPPER